MSVTGNVLLLTVPAPNPAVAGHAASAACSCVVTVEVVGTALAPARRKVPERDRRAGVCGSVAAPGGAGHRRDIRQRGEGCIAEYAVCKRERVGGYSACGKPRPAAHPEGGLQF